MLRQIRQVAVDVPVVMLTGDGDQQVALELMKAGAVDYVSKSGVTSARLAASLRYAVELARAAQEELRAGTERVRFLAEDAWKRSSPPSCRPGATRRSGARALGWGSRSSGGRPHDGR